ncbi:MAG TPA: nucleoside triphosphate pyrophosphohydrolase, partial [Methanocella sp.]|nr:nucleoside triphosphate pyrophosphohydrolase [Methanocella sp.]
EGKAPDVGRVSGDRRRGALKDKLVEEAAELRGSADAADDVMAELVDVLEVVDAIVDAYGLDRAEIGELKEKKRKERGGFKEGYYLKD